MNSLSPNYHVAQKWLCVPRKASDPAVKMGPTSPCVPTHVAWAFVPLWQIRGKHRCLGNEDTSCQLLEIKSLMSEWKLNNLKESVFGTLFQTLNVKGPGHMIHKSSFSVVNESNTSCEMATSAQWAYICAPSCTDRWPAVKPQENTKHLKQFFRCLPFLFFSQATHSKVKALQDKGLRAGRKNARTMLCEGTMCKEMN